MQAIPAITPTIALSIRKSLCSKAAETAATTQTNAVLYNKILYGCSVLGNLYYAVTVLWLAGYYYYYSTVFVCMYMYTNIKLRGVFFVCTTYKTLHVKKYM